MSLRSAWRALLLAPLGLDERADRLNQIAIGQGRSGVFVTALAIEVAADRASARVLNAGHPRPVLLGDGAVREVDAPPCPPLGVIAGAAWGSGEVALGPGSALLGYTDGLVEGRVAPGATERLGTAPVLELAGRLHAAGTGGDELLTALVALAADAGGGPPADDIAALLVEIP
jgi:serine phosphatase RsbU (regulator of sigma subunit)